MELQATDFLLRGNWIDQKQEKWWKTGKNKVSFAEAKFDLLGVNQFEQDFYTWLIV